MAARTGFERRVEGKLAECDGGGLIAGTRFAARQDFRGKLTGDYVDHGDPPWRWYLMGDLVFKPEAYEQDTVWCESGNIFILDGECDMPPGPEPVKSKGSPKE